MPEPEADPHFDVVQRTAKYALLAGIAIALLKFGIFWLTQSVAVLGDGLESLINIAAGGVMLYSIWYSNRPADREHPYGHGKIEFLAVGLEGWLILVAGIVIVVEAVRRLLFSAVELTHLSTGLWLLGLILLLDGALAGYVWHAGRKYANAVLQADGKHLLTDVASTAAVLLGLILVHVTGYHWLDPVVAVLVAGAILGVSWRLLWQSFHGLMDRSDPHDQHAIQQILDDEVSRGHIRGYHKVRHRRTGPFRWVDMHLHVDGRMTIAEGHELASRIEGRIERHFGRANATAHLEPYDPQRHPPAGLSAADLGEHPPANPATASHTAADDTAAAPASATTPPPPSSEPSPTPPAAPAHRSPHSSAPAPPPLDRPELAGERDPGIDDVDDGDAPPPPR